MDLSDPVDAAALRLYNETLAYLTALENGDDAPDSAALTAASDGYGRAIEDHLKNNADEQLDPRAVQLARQAEADYQPTPAELRSLEELAALAELAAEMPDGFTLIEPIEAFPQRYRHDLKGEAS